MSTAGTIELIVIVAFAVVLNIFAAYGIYGLFRDKGMKR